MRLRDALDTILSLVVLAGALLVIVQHGRLTLLHFQGLRIPLWSFMLLTLFWPALTLLRLLRGR